MKRIRKYSLVLTAIFALMAAVAAPFLIPENPDSAIFRSGAMGLLLLCAAGFPACEALRRAPGRTLTVGFAWGFLFACALSLGSELFVYDGLLSGLGAFVRRAAVPLLAAPLLGAIAARLMMVSPQLAASKRGLSMGTFMGVLVLCWLPLLVAFYPGMLNYDLETEYSQFVAGQWDARHPLLYIVITYGIYAIGQIWDHPTLALFAATVMRMVSFAAALGYGCAFVQRRSGRGAALAMLAFYALLPVFPVMAISSAKDTPFAAALLVLSLLCWEAIETPEDFFKSKRRCAAFVAMVVLTCHLRKNGVAAMLLLLPLLIVTLRGYRKRAAALCAAGAGAALLLSAGLNAVLSPVEQPSFQFYSLPAQQLVRAYNLGDMTDGEREELLAFYVDDDWSMRLYPHLADAAKGYIDAQMLAQNGDEFMNLWARVGRRNVKTYVEAFLMLNIGLWYPDDLSHADIYRDAYYLEKGYLQTDEYALEEFGVKRAYPLPAISDFVNRVCRQNEYQQYPVISQLLCTAAPLWAILFACALLVARKRTRYLTAAGGVLGLWVSYLFGPCTLARYVLPLFCLAPALLALSCCQPLKKEGSHD